MVFLFFCCVFLFGYFTKSKIIDIGFTSAVSYGSPKHNVLIILVTLDFHLKRYKPYRILVND